MDRHGFLPGFHCTDREKEITKLMSYVALYRKFRPQTFDQLKGQDHVVTALKNQLRKGRIGHSYLFAGTRGTGKTSAARILAKAVNCLHPVDGEPCNACENCLAVNAGNFVDVVEVDAASNNGVDDIRRLIEEVRYTPVKGKYKVYIIDEAHMITGPAFNAFLKTLEEPPAYAVFILATTEPHKLPVTILSRCQRYDFRRILSEEIVGNLAEIVAQEGISAEENALRYIARIGDGSMRDSISLLDKCIAFSLGSDLTYDNVLETLGSVDTEVFSRLFRSVYQADVVSALQIIDQAAADGRDLSQFAGEWIKYIRNILMIRAAGIQDPDVLGVSRDNMERMREDASGAEQTVLIRYIHELSELLNRLRYSPDKQILMETCVIRLATPQMETDVSSLTDRVRQLEQKIRNGMIPAMPPMGQTGNAPEMRALPPMPYMDEDETVSAGSVPESMLDPDVFADLMDTPSAADMYAGERKSGAFAESSPAGGAAPSGAGAADLWERMAASCGSARIRTAMKKCAAALSEEGTAEEKLSVYAPNIILMQQLQEESALELLRELAAGVLGRTVMVQVLKEEHPAGQESMHTGFPEDLLKNINMNIGTEEY